MLLSGAFEGTRPIGEVSEALEAIPSTFVGHSVGATIGALAANLGSGWPGRC